MDRESGLRMNRRIHGDVRGFDSFVPSRSLNIVHHNVDSHCVLDACDNVMMYGMTQSNGIQHQLDFNTSFQDSPPPDLYYSGRNPSSSTGALPLPQNYRASHQSSRFSAPNFHQSSIHNSSSSFGIYYRASGNRRSRGFPRYSRHQNLYLPTATASFHQLQSNPLHSAAVHYSRDSSEVRPRHAGPVPTPGRQMYRRNRRGLPRTNLGQENFRRVDLVQVDDIGMLVRDAEDMSYERLNALGEQIGNVSTGLSDETITNQMKTKAYLMAADAVNLEEATSQELEADLCVICQDEYKKQDMLGVLECGHEFHADCLRKWLLVRNVCPMCKSQALIPAVESGN
ncbi:hypothetical protein PIB30_011305 [Stylosanthes scabra]|uniref:RING-type E3 ubiquitin transferase n=1 Tax=Stylosanthes scabra TaxID=79078 RepID=A0ABU6V8D6_9FABA|nr:hypothetical protein [Stylosanthes scabra]